jgi:undecaprenyl-diphosphatase
VELLHILLLGIIQGIAEFLPISSSGHIVIVDALLRDVLRAGKLPDTNDVSIWLHAGTLASILVVYRRRILQLCGEDRRVVPRLLLATLPAVVVGLAVKFWLDEYIESPVLAGAMLPLTGLVLIWLGRQSNGTVDYQQLTYRQSLLIGAAQAVAILPGISRSGMTIAAGVYVGLRRDSAAAFSFLMAIPVIAGAVLLDVVSLWRESAEIADLQLLGIGAVVSFVVGVFSLRWLIRWLERGRIQYFAYWCIPLGIAVLVWQLVIAAV